MKRLLLCCALLIATLLLVGITAARPQSPLSVEELAIQGHALLWVKVSGRLDTPYVCWAPSTLCIQEAMGELSDDGGIIELPSRTFTIR